MRALTWVLRCPEAELALKQMISVMRNGGKISLLGLANGPFQMDMNEVIGKGLTLQGIYGRKMDNWHQMIYMVQGGLDLKPVDHPPIPLHRV